MPKLLAGVRAALGTAHAGRTRRCRAIMTTDSVPRPAPSGRVPDRWHGQARGCWRPACTMLSVITTGAVIDAADLDATFRGCVAATFDRVDADGCMSTNDTVIVLANGASGVPSRRPLRRGLHQVCADLSRQLAADAEGASKLIDVAWWGGQRRRRRGAARAVARSALFKCAMFGRIELGPCAVGRGNDICRRSSTRCTSTSPDQRRHGVPGLRPRLSRATRWTSLARDIVGRDRSARRGRTRPSTTRPRQITSTEFGVLDMNDIEIATTLAGALPWFKRFTVGSSSSSTAVTQPMIDE